MAQAEHAASFLPALGLKLSCYLVGVPEQYFLVCNMLLLERREEYKALYFLLSAGRNKMQLFVSWFRNDVIAYPRPLNSYVLLTWHFPESLQGLTPILCKACYTKACYLYATSCVSSLISTALSIQQPIQCLTKWPGQVSFDYIMSESKSINLVLVKTINIYTQLLQVIPNNF